MTTMVFVEAPGKQDLFTTRGATLYDAFTITYNDVAIDLTGWRARFKCWLHDSAIGTTSALSLDELSGITLGTTSGTVVIKATPTQTRTLSAGRYDYQLEFEDALGNVQTYRTGSLNVEEEIA